MPSRRLRGRSRPHRTNLTTSARPRPGSLPSDERGRIVGSLLLNRTFSFLISSPALFRNQLAGSLSQRPRHRPYKFIGDSDAGIGGLAEHMALIIHIID